MHIRQLRYLLIFSVLLFLPSWVQAQVDDEIYDDEILEEKVDSNRSVIKRPRRQRRERKPVKVNMANAFVGSGTGLDFWGNAFRIDISPHIGYRIGNHIAPAVGITYTYFYNFRTDIATHIYGPKAMLRIRPGRGNFYLHTELEYLTIEESNPYYSPSAPSAGPKFNRYQQSRINTGIGYTTNFETGAGFTTEILYDVYALYTKQTYINPFTYRIGFYYGF